jgi:hypothetical protein
MAWFFVLLLPSTAITLTSLSMSQSRDQISFYLSGALSLFVCAWYFRDLPLTSAQIKRMILFFTAAVYAIFALALTGTLNAPTESFLIGESSVVSSGGYGPNQVSSILGLGALLALIYLVILKPEPILRIFIFITLAVFLGQSALTLSRGGIYLFSLGALAMLFFAFSERRSRFTVILIVLVFSITVYFSLPRLDQFTAGGLTSRFMDTNTTGRIELMQEELQIWYSNLFFGVGPGMTPREVAYQGYQIQVASHNELTRILAEHGLFGLAAILILISIAVRNLRHANSPFRQGIVAALIVWSFATMIYTAIRFVAPAVMLGLSGAILLADQVEAVSATDDDVGFEETALNLPKPRFPRRITYRP